jgi:hypothetical protein
MTIPARGHFCWIGPRLPWAYAFALLSAASRSALGEIVLHHTDALADLPAVRCLARVPRIRLSRIDAIACLTRAGVMLGCGDAAADLYRSLASPVARADLLRAAILYLEGGIYLDLDTVTTASLLPLLGARQFVGCEFIVWPHSVRISRSPVVWARHLGLDLLRKLLRRMPEGWRTFRRVESFYFRGANNAVMGAEAGSPFFAEYLRAMLALPPARQGQPYALGPDLLQAVMGCWSRDDLVVHEPQVFYPLPPEISTHWFRLRRQAALHEVLSAETRVVHWYASVRGTPPMAEITPEYVRRNRERQLYSALVWASIDDLPGLT